MSADTIVGLVFFVAILVGVVFWVRRDKTPYGPSNGGGNDQPPLEGDENDHKEKNPRFPH